MSETEKQTDHKGYRIFGISYQLEIGKWVPKVQVVKIGTAPVNPKIMIWNEEKFYKDSEKNADTYAVLAVIHKIDDNDLQFP